MLYCWYTYIQESVLGCTVEGSRSKPEYLAILSMEPVPCAKKITDSLR